MMNLKSDYYHWGIYNKLIFSLLFSTINIQLVRMQFTKFKSYVGLRSCLLVLISRKYMINNLIPCGPRYILTVHLLLEATYYYIVFKRSTTTIKTRRLVKILHRKNYRAHRKLVWIYHMME